MCNISTVNINIRFANTYIVRFIRKEYKKMKLHITNKDYEVKLKVLENRKWNYGGDGIWIYKLPMTGCSSSSVYAVYCDSEDDMTRSWYEEIYNVITSGEQIIFYSRSEPMLDIPLKIVEILDMR